MQLRANRWMCMFLWGIPKLLQLELTFWMCPSLNQTSNNETMKPWQLHSSYVKLLPLSLSLQNSKQVKGSVRKRGRRMTGRHSRWGNNEMYWAEQNTGWQKTQKLSLKAFDDILDSTNCEVLAIFTYTAVIVMLFCVFHFLKCSYKTELKRKI